MPTRYNNRWLPKVLYTNTLDWLVGFILLIASARVLIGGAGQTPASVEALPNILSVAYVVFMVLGGVFIVAGLFLLNRFWANGLVRAGMWFAATAFGVYGVLLSLTAADAGSAGLAVATQFLLSAGCAVRAHGLGIDQAANLRMLQKANEERRRHNG